VLIGGLAAAIVIGWRRTVLIAIGLPILSAWLMRHLFASWMYETGYVRLYPRTSILILFGLLILAGFAVYWLVRRNTNSDRGNRADRGAETDRTFPRSAASTRSPRSRRPVTALALIPITLVIASAGSSLADRYMPVDRMDNRGILAWVAHSTPLPDGACTQYFQAGSCGR
jgi:hypothetical protein